MGQCTRNNQKDASTTRDSLVRIEKRIEGTVQFTHREFNFLIFEAMIASEKSGSALAG